MNNITPVVKNVIIINIIFFIATLGFSAQGKDLGEILGVYYFHSPKFRIWQPVTYMFMHSSINYMHIASNMFGLFIFGPILELHWGAKRFLNFYLLTGIGAVFFQWGVQAFELYQVAGSVMVDINQPFPQSSIPVISSVYLGNMVGASGAIFGVMAAFGMLYPNREMIMLFIPTPVKAKYLIILYIFIEAVTGLARIPGDTVAHFAHLGGVIIAFILVKLWRRNTNYYDYYE